MTAVKRIRQEYGSFAECVRHYASCGLSMAGTARQLDIDPEWFRRLCHRHKVADVFLPVRQRVLECKPGYHQRRRG